MERSSSVIRFFGGTILIAGVFALLAAVFAAWGSFTKNPAPAAVGTLKTFASCAALSEYIKVAQDERPTDMLGRGIALLAPTSEDSARPQKAVEYSTTNIQVAGVDEPDLVKTDGTLFRHRLKYA